MKQGIQMSDGERDRKFSDWLACNKAILFKVVHAYASGHQDRQDLLQDIQVQLWRSMDAFRGDSSLSTWVYRIALSTAIDWTRKETRHRRGKQPFDEIEGLLTLDTSGHRDPRLDWLYQKISDLNDVDRSVMLLVLDGFTYREISTIVGISESNVGVKICRIKAAMAVEHKEKQNDEPR